MPDLARNKRPARAWQRMLSGRRLDLLEPSPLDIEIEDIAHGLARVARWNGQTRGAHAFSVAQHCVLVERLVAELEPRLSRQARLMALLHDAPEYVVGDLISPFKAAVGINYKALEERLQMAIHLRFALPAVVPADLKALLIEFNDAAFLRPPPQVDRRSRSSGRATQMMNTGCVLARSARSSTNSSTLSSAQWISSSARTTGRRADNPVITQIGRAHV